MIKNYWTLHTHYTIRCTTVVDDEPFFKTHFCRWYTTSSLVSPPPVLLPWGNAEMSNDTTCMDGGGGAVEVVEGTQHTKMILPNPVGVVSVRRLKKKKSKKSKKSKGSKKDKTSYAPTSVPTSVPTSGLSIAPRALCQALRQAFVTTTIPSYHVATISDQLARILLLELN
mmetsp:Transcript_22555/g.25690  ORF Transcript_22555/g.25690 Transcript_22555/m.25690 type:complete len:170 (+) Transcript_22555:533-1042(+)